MSSSSSSSTSAAVDSDVDKLSNDNSADVVGTTTSTTDTTSLTRLRPSSIVGGDYAGIVATFNPRDGGTFIPIPEHLVPESLLEWGQEPWAMEVLVSEDFEQGQGEFSSSDQNDDTADAWYFSKRYTISILPETGCAIDNLSTMKQIEDFAITKNHNVVDGDNSQSVCTTTCLQTDEIVTHVFQRPVDDVMTLDAIFADTTIDEDTDNPPAENESGSHQHRIRIQASINTKQIRTTDAAADDDDFDVAAAAQMLLQSPIRLYWERQTSDYEKSSKGTIADGGGLDARTVARLTGERIRKIASLSSKPPPPSLLNKQATISNDENENDGNNICHQIHLPENISIRTSYEPKEEHFVIQISRAEASGIDDDDDGDDEKNREHQQSQQQSTTVQITIPKSVLLLDQQKNNEQQGVKVSLVNQ